MRTLILLPVLLILTLGCAHDLSVPLVPDGPGLNPGATVQYGESDGPYMLWGEWTFYFNAAHDSVDVVPIRQAMFHMNAMKFLEGYCTDCVTITKIENNGDETIDLTVKINHPFNGFPEYTGFDVKGIIMFTGSYEVLVSDWMEMPVPEISLVSWRELGDPEVLNADGYTPRWSPTYDSGLSAPIFNYREGKYTSGTPTAHINAFMNFYTHEPRHMFMTDGSVKQTYHIFLPAGEAVVAGYAVEACWEPPLVMPVTDPLTQFPITANQPEAYHFKYVINNGEPIPLGSDCCGDGPPHTDCSTLRAEIAFWQETQLENNDWLLTDLRETGGGESNGFNPCDPPFEQDFCVGDIGGDSGGVGIHRIVALAWYEVPFPPPKSLYPAWDVVDMIVVE